ncbi:hypothetical protein L6164_024695 [Bauhinia variegata]|uniref:Uncharacterized protein n=1 Tax=Bauhinia variegata TaxID=167791 RepID=A0ACB9LYB6_BAUVA|nr:hypothetical protein L6164_024695 [Bauhinia variegata]
MSIPRKSSSPLPSMPSLVSGIQQTEGDSNADNFVHNMGQSLQQRRLTRQRKLRHLSPHDVGLHFTDTEPSSLPATPQSSRKSMSPGGSDHWSSSAVPQPLPLPESPLTRRPESTTPNTGQAQIVSTPVEHPGSAFGRKDHAVGNTKSSSNYGRSSSGPANEKAKYNLRVKIPAASFSPGCTTPRRKIIDLFPSFPASNADNSNGDPGGHSSHIDSENICNLSLPVSAKSAPSSVLSSPVNSPRRSSNIDFFDPSIMVPPEFQDNHVGHSLKVSLAKAPHSPDHTPLRSLGSHSPYVNPKIRESPQHHKFFSRVWPENNHVDAHPLPLPPGATLPVPSFSQQQYQSSATHHSGEYSLTNKGKWQKGQLIGRGTFGSVYHATNLETGASCAMKEVDIIPDDPKSAECIKQLEQEVKILRQLNHPNIVQYYGSDIVGDHLYIYMEYVHPGSINKFVREHFGAMTESVVRNFTRHILSGLAYLHSTSTIHRDIKGANLLVDSSGIVKLADFGMAKILTVQSYDLSLKGSPYWMAPELMMATIKKDTNPSLAFAVDIWSLGCTIIEMLTGRPPWSEFEGPQAMFKVLHKTPPIPETLSSEGKDFLQQCFLRNPAERPSAAKLLDHAFVRNLHDLDQGVLVRPQRHLRIDMGDNSRSPTDSDKQNRDVNVTLIPSSMGTRFMSKLQRLIGDTSHQSIANTAITSSHSSEPEVNIRRSTLTTRTLNSMSVPNSRNIPLTVVRMITHL